MDTDGRLLMVNLTTADISDSAGAQAILDAVRKRMDKAAFRDFVIEIVRRISGEPGFKVLPRRWVHPWFPTKAWGCTMSEPPWREEGFKGLKLAYLAAQSGFFYDKHRALHDCMATLELLARPLPASGRTARPSA